MAESIVEIIHRLTFELSEEGLNKAIQKLKEQGAGIDALKKKQAELDQQMKKGNNLSVHDMQKLSNERQKVARLIEQETNALRKNFHENKKLQTALQQEAELIKKTAEELKRLNQLRSVTTDPRERSALNTQIYQTMSRTATSLQGGAFVGLSKAASEFNSIGGSFNQILREMPNFAISARIGIMSLTNNIGYLFERLNEARNAGQSWGAILRSLGSRANLVVFAINAIITVLTVLSTKWAENSKEVQDFEADLDNLEDSLRRQIKEMRELNDLLAGRNLLSDNVSEAQLKRRIDFLKASGAETEEIFSAEQELFRLRKANAEEELRNLNEISTAVENAFEHYRDFYGYAGFKKTPDAVKNVAGVIRDAIGEDRLSLKQATKLAEELLSAYDDGLQTIRVYQKERLQLEDDIAQIESDQSINAINFQKGLTEELTKETKDRKKNVRENRIRVKDLIELTAEEWAEQTRILQEKLDEIDRIRRERWDRHGTPGVIDTDFGDFTSRDIRQQQIGQLPTVMQIEQGKRSIKELEDIKAEARRQLKADDLTDVQRFNLERIIEASDAEIQTINDRKAAIKDYISAYQTMAQAIAQSLNNILQAQITSLDAEIKIREKRVDQAIRLAELGNTEILKIEQDRLNQSIREREQAARRQIAINSALQASESLVAIATAASQSGAGAIVIVPAVIAAIAAGFAAVTALSRNTQGFKEGVVDYQGKGTGTSDSNIVRISKGESVITADATKKNRHILEAMNNGQVFTMPYINHPVPARAATKLELKGVESKLDRMIEAYEQTGVNVNAKLDEQGFRMRTERNISKNKARMKR